MIQLKTSRAKLWFAAIGGLAAGFINGLLGAGGGIVTVFVLRLLLADQPDTPDQKDIFANALAVMLPISAVSAVGYATRGALPLAGASYFVFPAIIGGVGGALLLDRIRTETASRLFSLIVIYSGLSMLIR